ncbi:hypothetical protein BD410DRAFT_600712 [Rickenella mellea]|uniref:Glucose receptor Git3 N-terminal domain-containing protein n=1 Tax=Rickenella mellea TaxID=50990 RepID=A0A4Y7QDB3_9AGAM|nr:hypothetical protein BD410DRAFT_600712 [Rickenella mellea]
MAFTPITTKLQDGEQSGVELFTAGALLSIIAIIYLFSRIALAWIRPALQGWKDRIDSKEGVFFHTQLGIYAASLLVANFLTSTAGLIEIHWAAQGSIVTGPLCTTQASLIQIGDFAGAYFTSAMSIHTFITLVLKKRSPIWVTSIFIAIGWISSIFMGTLIQAVSHPGQNPHLGNAGLWCWIDSEYPLARFLLHCFPIILAAMVSVIMYSLVFLCLRGTIAVGEGNGLSLSLHGLGNRVNNRDYYSSFLAAVARGIIWYPIAFILLLAPITAAHLAESSGKKVSYQAYAGSAFVASLLGLANVVILSNTLRILAPAFQGVIPNAPRSPDTETFFCPGKHSPVAEKPPSVPIARPAKAFPLPTSRSVSVVSSQAGVPGVAAMGETGIPTAVTRLRLPAEVPRRVDSMMSSSSSRQLLPQNADNWRPGHAHGMSTDSAFSHITAGSRTSMIGQQIISTEALNKHVDSIARAEPPQAKPIDVVGDQQRPAYATYQPKKSMENISLPPPPRQARSNVQKRPSLESDSVPDSRPLRRQQSTENLLQSPRPKPAMRPKSAEFEDVSLSSPNTPMVKTPKTASRSRASSNASQHDDEFISLYLERNPASPGFDANGSRVRPAISAVAHATRPLPRISQGSQATTLTISRNTSSSASSQWSLSTTKGKPDVPESPPSSNDHGTSGSDSEDPLSPYYGRFSGLERNETSLRKQVHQRTEATDAEISSLAWASLVTNAAFSNGGPSRSSSLVSSLGSHEHDGKERGAVPTSLQPRTSPNYEQADSNLTFERDEPSDVSEDSPTIPPSPFTGRVMDAAASDPQTTVRSGPKKISTSSAASSQQEYPSWKSSHSRTTTAQPGFI